MGLNPAWYLELLLIFLSILTLHHKVSGMPLNEMQLYLRREIVIQNEHLALLRDAKWLKLRLVKKSDSHNVFQQQM